MLEKLGIRVVTSLIVMWYLFQFYIYKFQIEIVSFLAMLFYAFLISLIIESLLGLLRNVIKWTPYIIIFMIIVIAGSYFIIGVGLYSGLITYSLCFVSIDLYREYSITKLLKNVLDNHS